MALPLAERIFELKARSPALMKVATKLEKTTKVATHKVLAEFVNRMWVVRSKLLSSLRDLE